MNRLFSDLQRRSIFLAADGRCQTCGELLDEVWDAHHIVPHSQGGVTEVWNGMALCKPCHIDIHKEIVMKKKIEPRGWQKQGLEKFSIKMKAPGESVFFLDAAPGAGKSFFSAFCARQFMEAASGKYFFVVVSPSAEVRDNFASSWSKLGIDLMPDMPKKISNDPPKSYQGVTITYQKLNTSYETIKWWASKGTKIFVVFDEIHHACESNSWGHAANEIADSADFVLCMTGTPFRTDDEKVSFLNYTRTVDENGEVFLSPQSDFKYEYLDGLLDKVLRPVEFRFDDGIARYRETDKETGLRSEDLIEVAVSQDDGGKVVRSLLDCKGDFLKDQIRKADAKLDEIRKTDPDAGGLIVCMPESSLDGLSGNDDEQNRLVNEENKLVNGVANLVRSISSDGAMPAVVVSEDQSARDKISQFRKNKSKWIVAKRMISEGTDIPRLRVLVLACRPLSEMLFRQLIGRVLRQINPNMREVASVFLMLSETLVGFAKNFERDVAIAENKPEDRKGGGGGGESQPIFRDGSSLVEGGMIYYDSEGRREFTSQWIEICRKARESHPYLSALDEGSLFDLSKDAPHLFDFDAHPPKEKDIEKPKHEWRKEKTDEINQRIKAKLMYLHPDDRSFPYAFNMVKQKFDFNLEQMRSDAPDELFDEVLSWVERADFRKPREAA